MYLTSHRVFGWNKAFNKILFEAPLARIRTVEIGKGIYHKEEHEGLRMILKIKKELYLHSRDLIELQDSLYKLILESPAKELISCK